MGFPIPMMHHLALFKKTEILYVAVSALVDCSMHRRYGKSYTGEKKIPWEIQICKNITIIAFKIN